MMIRAYQEIYLNSAQAMLGDAFDYAINICHYTGEDFVKMFVVSPISKRIENGEPTYLKGKSGIEVLIDIVYETTGKIINVSPIERFRRSPEYWIGWRWPITNGIPVEALAKFYKLLALLICKICIIPCMKLISVNLQMYWTCA